MNLIRCSAGHFYDAEKYSSCPHCSGGGTAGQDVGVTEAFDPTMPLKGGSDAPTEGIVESLSEKTEPMTGAISPEPFFPSGGGFPDFPDTIPLGDMDNDKTISIFAGVKKMEVEPVVGWLVCIEGEHFGEDFRLRTGKNYIGRSEKMDIILRGEDTVSRDKHVIVLFEPKQSIFLVQPGESKELAYLNEDLILAPQVLKSGDIISVGKARLLFVPFCSKGFNWATIS